MREEVVRFGEAGLVGVVSEPDTGPADGHPRPGVLLLNSGLISRIGPNRLYVTLARRLAERGFTVLRFDLSAIGDSPARGDTLPFRDSAVRETREAMDFLGASRGLKGFLLAGICTGAVVALRTALAADEVRGAALVNAQDLLTRQTNEGQAYVAGRASARYYLRTAVMRPRSWLKFLAGRASYRSILGALGARLPGASSRRAPTETTEAQTLRDGLKRLAKERGNLLLLYSEGDRGIDELDLILGGDRDWLAEGNGTTYQIVPRADHMFTARDSQEAFLDRLMEWAGEAAAPDRPRSASNEQMETG
jgi:pimeloyl-ACP methyl ester carboxylesterase